MRPWCLPALLVCTIGSGIAVAQSPVAYVYVAQTDQFQTESVTTQPIYAYSVDAAGKVTPVPGSPFIAVTGQMVGTTGTHFVTHGYGGDLTGGDLPLNYLYS